MRTAPLFAFLLAAASTVAADKGEEDKSALDGYATVYTAKTTTTRYDGSSHRAATYLGVHLGFADGKGFVVAAIDDQSPAGKAGLKENDVVKSVDGEAIGDPARLRAIVQGKLPGEAVVIRATRDGKPVEVKVALGIASRPLADDGSFQRRVQLGVYASPTDKGFRIDHIVPSSPADAAGLKPGDVIFRVNGKVTDGKGKISDLLTDFNPGDRVKFTMRRGDGEIDKEVTLTPASGNLALPRGWDDRRGSAFRGAVYKLAVIPIEYPDQKLNPKIKASDWDAALFSENSYRDKSATGEKVHGSLRDYYREVSAGKLRVEGKVFGAVTVAKDRMDYATGDRQKFFDDIMTEFVGREGADALKAFDGVFLLYAGEEAASNRQALYWAHQGTFTFRGVRHSYFINPEGGKRMESIGVIVHEFGHLLGMPDLYYKPELPNLESVGGWCTMANGHGKIGRPVHFGAWCKEQLDWLKPAVIDPTVPQKLVLSPVENGDRECFKVLITPDGAEYLLLENRTKKGYDTDLPGEGLLIWRVVEGRPMLEEAHGIPGAEAASKSPESVPYPSASNAAFTPFTVPSSQSSRRGARPVHITNIRKRADGRVTFQIGYELF